jgi:YVTN family beta-propeller protein
MTKTKWLLVWCVILLQVLLFGQRVEAQVSTACQYTLGSGYQPALIAVDYIHSSVWVTLFQANKLIELSLNNPSCGLIRTLNSPSLGPYGIVFDGTYIWETNNASSTLGKLNAATGALVANLGGLGYPFSQPRGVVFDGSSIWVANYGNNTVSKIRASDDAYIQTIGVGSGPYVLAENLQDGSIWVPNRNSHTISVIANSSGTVTMTLQTDGEPQFVAAGVGGNMWVSCYSAGTVEEFSSSGTLLRRVNPTASGQVGGPTGIAWDPVGSLLWGASNSGWVYSIDANGNVGNITKEGGSGNAHLGVTYSGSTSGTFWTADTGAGIIQLLNP